MQESSNKILIIEDDATTRKIFNDALEAEGFNSISAENATVGIWKAQELLPDLVLCDMIMSDMDGLDVLRKLRQNPVTAIIPFIFLSGSDNPECFRKCMELGADDYILKPCTVNQLLRAIAIRLEKQAKFMQYWHAAYYDKRSQAPSTNATSSKDSKSIFPLVPELKPVFDYIEANYHRGITLCDVALALGYSSAYLTHRVAKITGETVNVWIVKRRMDAARSLLQDTNHTIEQIASTLGYQNTCHFSRQFRQHHGLPPHAWRRKR